VEVQGEPMVVTTIRDISLRKKAEKELRQSQQRLRDVQRLAGLATWSYDVSTEEVTWSEETFSLIGRSVTEGVPTKEEFFEIIHPDDRGKLQQAITTALDSGAAYELPVRQIRPGGDLKSLLVRGQPIFDESGKAIEIYGVLIPQRCD
jgi:PAS domain-containing protein